MKVQKEETQQKEKVDPKKLEVEKTEAKERELVSPMRKSKTA